MTNNCSFDKRGDKKKYRTRFWVRFISNLLWLLLANTLLVVYITKDGPLEYVWIPVLFFGILLIIETYISWRKEKYLLLYLSLDIESKLIHVIVNKFDEVYIDGSYPVSSVSVELKELRLGRLYVPNYMLVLKNKGEVILKQRGNSVWKRTEIKRITKQLMQHF